MGRYLLMFAGWLKIIKAKFSVSLLAFLLLFFVALVSTSTFSGIKEKAKRAKMAHVYWIWSLKEFFLEATLWNFNLYLIVQNSITTEAYCLPNITQKCWDSLWIDTFETYFHFLKPITVTSAQIQVLVMLFLNYSRNFLCNFSIFFRTLFKSFLSWMSPGTLNYDFFFLLIHSTHCPIPLD